MRSCFIFILMLLSSFVWAQKKEINEGNKLFKAGKYDEAAKIYQQALQKDPKMIEGAYNLGDALYMQKNYEGSRKIFETSSKMSNDDKLKVNSHYNIGNTYMQEQKWKEAVESYKAALRKNPQDEDAKYNLSYALAKMKQNQQNQNDKNKNQQNQQDNKENKDQKDNKDSKDKKDEKNQQQQQDKKDKQAPKEQEKKPQPQESKLSEQQADQLLNALAQEEKKLHDKKEKGKATMIKVDKDW